MTSNRLSEYFKIKGLTAYTVENELGLGRGALYKAIVGNKSIGSGVLENILIHYSDLNAEWLLTGNGEMLKNSTSDYRNSKNSDRLVKLYPNPASMEVDIVEKSVAESIAYYNEYASAGLMLGISEGKTHPDSFINVPGLNDCDIAINVYGESMTPVYQPGQIIICKKVPVDPQMSYVRYGEAYLAFCDDGPVIKYIKKCDDNDYLVFASENEDYEPYIVHKNRIRELYLIKGAIARKSL